MFNSILCFLTLVLLSLSLIHTCIYFSPAMTTYFLGLADNDIHNPAKQRVANGYRKLMIVSLIGHVNEYPTMHYFVIPSYSQSMIAYRYIILTAYFWKLHLNCIVGMLLTCPILVHSIIMYSHITWFENMICKWIVLSSMIAPLTNSKFTIGEHDVVPKYKEYLIIFQ